MSKARMKIDPMDLASAKKLQAESKARVTQLQQDIASLPIFALNQALNSPSSSPEQKELYIQLETTRKAALLDLKNHAAAIDKVDLGALQKGTASREIERTLLHGGAVSKGSPADHAHSTLSITYLEKMKNVQALTETLKNIGESLSKENDALNKRKQEMSSLTRDSDRKAVDDRQAVIGSAYNEIGKSFVNILSATDATYAKDVLKAKKITRYLTKIHEDLSRLKGVAELNRDFATVATYNELQSLITPLFLKAGHTEDLHTVSEIYCSLLTKIQPQNKIQELLNSYIKNEYGSTKDLLVQELDKLIAECEMGQVEIQSLKEKGKVTDKECGILWDHFQKNIALLNTTKLSVKNCHDLLTQGKTEEHEKAVEELRKLYPEKSPVDKLVAKTQKDIKKLTTELDALKVSADRYVLNFGVRNSVPIVQHLVSLIAPVIMPTISSGIKQGLSSANEFINDKLHVDIGSTIQTVEKGKESVLSTVATTAKDTLGEVIDKIPIVDVSLSDRDLRTGEQKTTNIHLNVPGFLKDKVDEKIDSMTKDPVISKIEDKAKDGIKDEILGATPTVNHTDTHLTAKKTTVGVTPDPGWHTPWTEHLKNSAKSTALGVVKSAGVFAICTLFPPAAAPLAIASLAASSTSPLYHAVQKELKDKEEMDQRISAIATIEQKDDKEEMDKTRVAWEKQSTLFKSLSTAGFPKLEVDMRKLPTEMHQTFQTAPPEPEVEEKTTSTAEILQQFMKSPPAPAPAQPVSPTPAPAINTEEKKPENPLPTVEEQDTTLSLRMMK